MALQKEVWKRDIIGNLFKNNAFALRSVNADDYVLEGKVVHMPVAGLPTKSKKNLTTFPQTATNRTDTELTYILDKYYQLPKTIEKLETYELSYDKRQSVAGDMESQLIEDMMEGLLQTWSPSGTSGNGIILTTGDNTADDLINSPTTGFTRKIFTSAVFKTAAKIFAKNKLANKTKVALLTAVHYYEFLNSLTEGEKTAVNNVADLKEGSVGRYYGFDIMLRDTVGRYNLVNGVYTPVDTTVDNFTGQDSDANMSLFYADESVERAVGEINIFDDAANPLYYGDVLSMNSRMGGRIRRSSGVIAAVDTVTAA